MLSHIIPSGGNEETFTVAATTASLFSPLNNNSSSANLSQNSCRMKCYYHKKQKCFIDYFDDPIPDDAVIYVSDILFQYNEIEGRYTEFIGKSRGTIL